MGSFWPSTTLSSGAGGGMYNYWPPYTSNPTVPVLTEVTFHGNSADYGGGLYNERMSPALQNVNFSANTAQLGGGMYNIYASPGVSSVTFYQNTADQGGGMFNLNSSSPSLSDVLFVSNSAVTEGGAIWSADSSPTLFRTRLDGNQAPDGYGGALTNYRGSMQVLESVFTNNVAGAGGAIYNDGTLLTISDSTFTNNMALISANTFYGSGGAIASWSQTLTVTRSTFAGNHADYRGGAIYGPVEISNSTISGNSAPVAGGGIYGLDSLVIRNSTLTGNQSNMGGAIYSSTSLNLLNSILANSVDSVDCFTTGVIGGLNNIIETQAAFPYGCGSLSNIKFDPMLGPLQDNGGLTRTHALLAGSPAIDAGNDPYCEAADQRGISRPQGVHCDIGAYELDNAGPLAWNTFLGMSASDSGAGIAVDTMGNRYVIGMSPAAWGSPVRDYAGATDVFIAKLDSSGALVWNTFLGGAGNDGRDDVAASEPREENRKPEH